MPRRRRRRNFRRNDRQVLFFDDDAPTLPMPVDPDEEWDQCDTVPGVPGLDLLIRESGGKRAT